eukprot:COSAG01_NODE_303_length_19167_cov_10.792454_2_plen_119_part_00
MVARNARPRYFKNKNHTKRESYRRQFSARGFISRTRTHRYVITCTSRRTADSSASSRPTARSSALACRSSANLPRPPSHHPRAHAVEQAAAAAREQLMNQGEGVGVFRAPSLALAPAP